MFEPTSIHHNETLIRHNKETICIFHLQNKVKHRNHVHAHLENISNKLKS